MKIAITSSGEDCHANVDSRFGRADYFVIYDEAKKSWDCLANTQNLEAAHGAGIQAGQTLLQSGANVLITGHVGPKAFKVLQTGNVNMFALGNHNGSVEEALSAYMAGELAPITEAKSQK